MITCQIAIFSNYSEPKSTPGEGLVGFALIIRAWYEGGSDHKEDEVHFNNDFHYLFNDDTIDIRPTESGKFQLDWLPLRV